MYNTKHSRVAKRSPPPYKPRARAGDYGRAYISACVIRPDRVLLILKPLFFIAFGNGFCRVGFGSVCVRLCAFVCVQLQGFSLSCSLLQMD